MKQQQDEVPNGIELKVKKSPISGSGIARVHISITDLPEFSEGKVASLESEKRKRVLRLVSDNMMEKGKISLRQTDMEKLGVKEGMKIKLLPVKSVTERLGKKLKFLKK